MSTNEALITAALISASAPIIAAGIAAWSSRATQLSNSEPAEDLQAARTRRTGPKSWKFSLVNAVLWVSILLSVGALIYIVHKNPPVTLQLVLLVAVFTTFTTTNLVVSLQLSFALLFEGLFPMIGEMLERLVALERKERNR